jgi:hypothetical protein
MTDNILYKMDISDDEIADSVDLTISQLAKDLETMRTTVNLLGHKLHTFQTLMEQDKFEYDDKPVTVIQSRRATSVRKLLAAMDLPEEGLTLGVFLRALNRHLIQEGCVDLNDLQILLTPLLCSAFHKAPGLKKVPYPLLLLALPQMFS